VHDHVRAECQRLLQEWRREGVVDADDRPGVAAGGAQSGKVGNVKQRIGGGLQPEQVCAAGWHEAEHGSDRGHAGGESHGVTALHLAHGCLECLPGRRGVCACV